MSCMVPSGVFHCIATCKGSLPLLSVDIQTIAICRHGKALLSPTCSGIPVSDVPQMSSPSVPHHKASSPVPVPWLFLVDTPRTSGTTSTLMSPGEIFSSPTGYLTSTLHKTCQIRNSSPPLSPIRELTLPAPAPCIFNLSQ